jgi:CubicO group peptidase (beta-lactamase class C family)
VAGLQEVLQAHCVPGGIPGAVALVAHGDRAEVAVVGSADVEGTVALTRDALFRIATMTKPITAAAAMVLVDDGRLALDDPVARWLPELASPMVVRHPAGPIDDVVPADRPITVEDLLTFRADYGFPSDFSLPAVQPLFSVELMGPFQPQRVAAVGVRRLGGRGRHRPLERARSLRLGRRLRHCRAPGPLQRIGHHPPHPAGTDRSYPT